MRLFPDIQNYPLEYAPILRVLRDMCGLGIPLILPYQGLGSLTKIAKLTKDGDYPVIVVGCSYNSLSEFIVLAGEHRHIYIETHLLDSPDAFEILVKRVGADRLIFGSGIPLTYFKASYMMVEKAEISDEDKSLILGGNISRLIGGL